MKRKLCLFIAGCFITFLLPAQQPSYDDFPENAWLNHSLYTTKAYSLNGAVKKYQVKKYWDIKTDSLDLMEYSTLHTLYFDRNGNLLKQETHNTNGVLLELIEYEFLDKAIITKETMGDMYDIRTFVDSAGNEGESEVLNVDTNERYIELLNDAGQPIFSTTASLPAGKTNFTIEELQKAATFLYSYYTYDNSKRLKEAITYEPDGNGGGYFYNNTIYKYNNDGLMQEVSFALNDTAGNGKHLYAYNDNKRCIKETSYHNEKLLDVTTYEYYPATGKLKSRSTEYFVPSFFSKTTETYEYGFDKLGNVVYKKTLSDGKLKRAEAIEIEYYE